MVLDSMLVLLYFIIYIFIITYSTVYSTSSYFLTVLGLTLLSLFLISIYIKKFLISKRFLLYIFFFTIIILTQTILSTFIYGERALFHSLMALILLFFCFVTFAPLFNKILFLANEKLLKKIIKTIYLVLLILGYIAFYLQYKGVIAGKDMLFISEPSHYAILMIPLLIFVLLNAKYRMLYLLPFIILTLLIQNATMLVGVILSVFLAYKINVKLLFVAILILIFMYIFLPKTNFLSYFIDRFTLNRESDISKLSTLVYLSGFERAYLSLLDSRGIGLGFDRMGYVGPHGYYQNILSLLGFAKLNIYDGSANAFKIVAELGLFGLLILLIYIYYFLKIMKKMKNRSIIPSHKILLYSYFLSYSIELFVRGFGYFSFNLPFFLASVYMIVKDFDSKKNLVIVNNE